VLAGRGRELLARIRAAGQPEDLAVSVAVLLARPFRSWFGRRLAGPGEHGGWVGGSCPVCGHWPALSMISEQDEGRRWLWCLHCGTDWPHARLRCPFCDEGDPAALEHPHLAGDDRHRLQACRSCRRYVKEFRWSEGREQVPWDAVFFATAELDLMAAERGFLRESPLVSRLSPRASNRTTSKSEVDR